MNIVGNAKGFTLIEVLMAMVVLAVGTITLYTMQTVSIKGNAKANSISMASNATRDTIENVMNQSYSNVISTNQVINELPIVSTNWVVTEWRTDSVDNDGDGDTDEYDERGVKNVQLTITYTEMGATKRTTVDFLKTEIF